MPGPVQDLVVSSSESIAIDLAPAQAAFNSLYLLTQAEHLSGLGDWVTETARALTPEERSTHETLFIGLYYSVAPLKSWPSFPAYIEHLATCNPITLRDKLLKGYLRVPLQKDPDKRLGSPDLSQIDTAAILESADTYLSFLLERFDAEYIDEDIERRSYEYVRDPRAMQELISSHLRLMWTKYLATEWERVRPMLEDAVRAFRQVDFGAMNKLEIAELVTGNQLAGVESWEQLLNNAEKIVFFPSAHAGPYPSSFCTDEGNLWMVFGARLPTGTQIDAPDLSRAEIVVRLNALADDTRLRVLKLIADQKQLYSQEIMQALDLSQSAASRHLKQLSATGYLTERRINSAKQYTLNPERIRDTLQAISAFLLND